MILSRILVPAPAAPAEWLGRLCLASLLETGLPVLLITPDGAAAEGAICIAAPDPEAAAWRMMSEAPSLLVAPHVLRLQPLTFNSPHVFARRGDGVETGVIGLPPESPALARIVEGASPADALRETGEIDYAMAGQVFRALDETESELLVRPRRIDRVRSAIAPECHAIRIHAGAVTARLEREGAAAPRAGSFLGLELARRGADAADGASA